MQPVRIAVHSSDPITFRGVTSYLEAHDAVTTVPLVRPLDADLLVLAFDLVSAEIIRTLRDIARESNVRTILLTSKLAETDLLTAVECRVVAVLPRYSTNSDRLIESVHAAMNGHGVLPPDLLGTLLDQVKRLKQQVPISNGLEPREIDVLRLLADGLGTHQIAEKLCYSERTVKNVLHGIMTRLNLRNRAHAVAYAMRAGLV